MNLGIALPEGAGLAPGDLLAAVDRLPAVPSHVPVWCRWGDPSPDVPGNRFPLPEVKGLTARGIRPVVFWEPTGAASEHRSILRGDHDAYIDGWAHDAADCGTVLVRFAHEANGSWFPWSPGKGTNTDQSYLSAWRYVVGRVRDIAPRCLFVWCVNVTPRGGIRPLWPGDYFVDRVALDGYAWKEPLRDPERIFGRALAIVRDLSDRPVLVTEFAATAAAKGRVRWFREALAWFEAQGVSAAIWLSIDLRGMGHQDWRMGNGLRTAWAA